VRKPFVHEASLQLAPGADDRAPGAAVTVELCGHWEHEGRCRWPHHTAVESRTGTAVTIRIVFACEPGDEPAVRARIARALAGGLLDGPGGASRWTVLADAAAPLREPEAALAERLADQEPGRS
jgi:hypothetical protein